LYPLEGAGDFDTKDVGIEAQAIVGDKNLTCDAMYSPGHESHQLFQGGTNRIK